MPAAPSQPLLRGVQGAGAEGKGQRGGEGRSRGCSPRRVAGRRRKGKDSLEEAGSTAGKKEKLGV